MTTPDQTDQNPDESLAARIHSLQTAHPWMDPAATVTLANGTSDTEAHGIADSLKQQVSGVWDGISHFFDDPVLHQTESASLTLQRYIRGTTGAWPIEDRSLSHIQSQLQAKGFGAGLDVNGKWDSGWQAALQQHALAEYNAQISGNQPGAKSSHGLLHSLLDSISPSGVADSVVGFVKSIPGDVRQVASDAGGTVSQAGHGVEQLFTSPGDLFKRGGDVGKATHEARGSGQAAVNQALGGSLTKEQAVAQAGTGADFANWINDVGTVFLLSGMGSAGSAIGKSLAKENAAGLTTRITAHEAAQRGQGVVAKSLLKPVVGRTVTGAALGGAAGGTTAALTGGDVGKGIGTGAVLGGLTGGIAGRSSAVRESAPVRAAQSATDKALSKVMPDRYYQNLPIAGNTGPILGRLANDEGLYYTARTRLATPYQYGGVRAVGTAFSQGQAFSLKAHGIGYLEHLFGGDTGQIQQSIDNANVLDPINDLLRNRLEFTAAGMHFTPDLNYLMFFLHGPLRTGSEGTTSQSSGDSIKGLMDSYSDALGHTSLKTQVEQATGHSYDELLAAAGGDPTRLDTWVGNKAKQAAALLHAERVYATGHAVDPTVMPDRFTDAYHELLRAESSAVWHDPAAMKTAVASLVGGNDNYMQNFIKDEITRSLVKPNAYLKHELGDFLDAGDTLTHGVLPHADQFLLKPKDVHFLPKGVDPSVFTRGVPNELREQGTVLTTGPTVPGSIGLARTSTLTSQDAARDVQSFADRLEAIAEHADPAMREALSSTVHDEMNAYLFHNFGLDARRLNVFSGTPEKALSLIQDRAKQLAAEVHLTADAPEELKTAFEQIGAKGYKVVAGTDIGHAFRNDLAPLKELGAPLTRARKIAQSLGVSPQSFSRLDYGVDRRLRVVSALQKAVDDGEIRLPSFYTAQTLLNELQDDKLVAKQLPWAAHVLFSASRRAHQGAVEDLIRTGKAEDPAQALGVLESHIAAASGMRSLTYKDFKRVLGRTDNVPWMNATRDSEGTNTIPLMDEASIKAVFKAVQKGYSETPASMLGAQKVEDFLRYLPFRVSLGDKHLPFAISSLPTGYARFRDTYRFTLSPYFDLRRVAKTNVKMAADGVPPTVHPVAELRRNGHWDDAHNKLDALLGEENAKYRYLDEADRYLDSQGVFGLYNPRHYEAYYVAQKLAAGATDQEIKDGIVRVFQYGSRGKEGRTALERTTNVIFFPFSFEKTVARNIGSYLLDHGAQAMILSNSLDAYRQFSANHANNPLSMKWIETHTPLMEEFLRLNTFAHGMSMGELGGVNRPLLNMFLPQSYATGKDTTKALQRFIPLSADLHRIVNESKDQNTIIATSLRNGLDQIANGAPKSVLRARPVAQTQRAQLDKARIYRSELLNSFEQVLAYNSSVGSDEEKITWGLGPGIPPELRGQPISKTTLGQVVHDRYPAYDPLKAADYAIQKKVNAEQWLSKRIGTEQYPAYKDFYEKAQTAIAHLNKDDYPTAQAAKVQDLFRQRAIDFAQADPAFLKWYNATFKSAFGPLEAIR